jgi:PhnB protein
MASVLNPYINFDGTTREAMEFYKEVFGGELNLNTYGDLGGASGDPEHQVDVTKIMHGQLTTTSGFTLMAADTPPGMPFQPGNNISVSLSGDDRAELKGYWDKLAEGGQVPVPLEKQMWGDEFGMCVDRFGITWMVNIAAS